MADKPWAGRFGQATDHRVEEFTESVNMDKRLYEVDIRASKAHATMLGATGIISREDADAIKEGLSSIQTDIEEGRFSFDPGLEDVHMNIEAELSNRIGDAGKRLHTARSRNDQVATDLRLYVRDELVIVKKGLVSLMGEILNRAKAQQNTIIPGMTHLQHAQGVSLGHHLLAYLEMFYRDYLRFNDAMTRLNVSPLGSAALAGTPHPIDRFMTAEELGFDAPCANSIDGVSDRDFVIDAIAAACTVMMHLSRLSEEIIIWNSQEFSFVELPDAYSTGSSIMPQKKNPDVAELIRGKVGRVYGDLINILTTMKALPLAYNRDMQEDKWPVFDAIDTVKICIEMMTGLLNGLVFNHEAISAALGMGFITATDIADYLSKQGVPFRQAHHITGELVASLIKQGRTIGDMTLEDFRVYSDCFTDDILERVSDEGSLKAKTSHGGTSPNNVSLALDKAEDLLHHLCNEA
ncbi:MAG: argininosuccinate lyase [Thermodesulfobacteriota bacterium]|nr:argininosuccinate lyase [Thermodesulfobacteriota bacterium]